MRTAASHHRFNTLLALVVGLLLAVAAMVLASPPAYAKGPTPETASPIGSLPFSTGGGSDWLSVPAATGAANAALSAACNGGGPLYRVRWFTYTPSATKSVAARGAMEWIRDRDHFPVGSGVAILDSARAVIDCNVVGGSGGSDTSAATAGPVKVSTGTKVYIVQFVTQNPPDTSCDEVIGCDGADESLLVREVGAYPISDNWANAEPITAIPATRTVDTTLSTQESPDLPVLECESTATAATRTVWWSVSPTTTGSLDATVTWPYNLGYGEVTPSGVVPLENCFDYPPTLQAGKTYLIEAGLPQFNRQDEPLSGGPVTLTINSGPSLGKPDLVVTRVVSSPASPKAGDSVSFRATIKNQGTAPTQGGVVHGVSFKVDGVAKTWSDTFNGSLLPGQSVTVTANGGKAGAATWPAVAGSHTVLATVDDVNRVPGEVSESNNTRSVSLSVAAGPGRPDLVVTGVSWTPSSPGSGAPVTFKATIKNQGSAATPAGVVHGVVFKVDGAARTWSDTSTASLAAGASRTVTATGGKEGKASWPASAGQHTVQAVVDDINRIKSESDETNNALAVPFNVGAAVSRPDLVVTGVSWSPASPASGGKVRLTATVQNVGTRSTPAGKVVGVSFRPNGQTTGTTYSDTWSTPVHPGQIVTLTANGGGTSGAWTVPAGSTPVVAIVDDINRITEANEANNTLTTTVGTG